MEARHDAGTVLIGRVVKAHGNRGEVRILFTIVKRREVSHLVEIVREFNPKAFYTIEDVNFVSRDYALSLHHQKSIFNKLGIAKKK